MWQPLTQQPPLAPGSTFTYYGEPYLGTNCYQLVVVKDYPTDSDIFNMRHGLADFGFLELPGQVIFFLHRFGSLPWTDSYYCWHEVPEDHRVPPPAEGGENDCALLNVSLIDSRTAATKVTRLLPLAPDFTVRLNNAIRRQIPNQFSYKRLGRWLRLAGRRWPDAAAMVAGGLTAVCSATATM